MTIGVEQAAKMSATHFAKVVAIEVVAGFAAGLVGSATKQAYYNDGKVDAGDLFIAGGWSAAGGLASGAGMAAATRHLQKAVEAGYKIHVPQCLGQSEYAKRAVKGAISTIRPALGVPVKEGGPRLADAMKGGRFESTPMA